MDERVQYEYYENGDFGIIHLNHPKTHHAICTQMTEEIKVHLQTALRDEIKFLVITSTGDRMFCAGGDLNDLNGDLTPEEAFSHLYPMKEVLFELVSFPVPTICLLNGDALGGGCEIATACDFRIAKETATFGFIQASLGILPGWGGGRLLYEKVHPSFAYQWLVEAETYDATFLENQGWIHKIIPTSEWENYETMLKPYINKSYEQMKMLKSQYKKRLSVLALSAEMNEEVRNCANLWDSKEHIEMVQQFLARKLDK